MSPSHFPISLQFSLSQPASERLTLCLSSYGPNYDVNKAAAIFPKHQVRPHFSAGAGCGCLYVVQLWSRENYHYPVMLLRWLRTKGVHEILR